LAVDDVLSNLPQELGEDNPESRLTLQYFVLPRPGGVLATFAPHNSDAREPQDARKWPPAIILDLFYAAAVLQTWGTQTFVKYAREKAGDAYYDNAEGDDSALDECTSGSATSNEPEDPNTHRTRIQVTERSARYARRSGLRTETVDHAGQPKATRFSELMDGVMALWMQSTRKGQGNPQDTCTSKQDDIQTWLESTEESVSMDE
jgi:hypothetical protein